MLDISAESVFPDPIPIANSHGRVRNEQNVKMVVGRGYRRHAVQESTRMSEDPNATAGAPSFLSEIRFQINDVIMLSTGAKQQLKCDCIRGPESRLADRSMD